ncbi:gamma-glutamylcyclotransferase [Paenibacillus chartarius]|uniref:Gamma-glutamylcyclotransferase n=1 Tax=Paenibacillus chartarius TaxID=747481 RepID=A0ABV6DMR2_9BACL
MCYVFVYGTLLPGERNHHIAAPYVTAEPKAGAVRGWLYDYGPYPGLVLDKAAPPVEGVWLKVTEEGLAAMDALEEYFGPSHPGNDYERVEAEDAASDMRGWVYVWADSRGCPLISCGSWRKR